MSEIADFVRNGASKMTPRIVLGLHKKLPLIKVQFAQIHAPDFPHLIDQLEFLADLVEDFIDGADDEIPYATLASAAFALVYAHRQLDLIPDSVPEYGRADDSGVVRAVLIEHKRAFKDYADRHNLDWSTITLKP